MGCERPIDDFADNNTERNEQMSQDSFKYEIQGKYFMVWFNGELIHKLDMPLNMLGVKCDTKADYLHLVLAEDEQLLMAFLEQLEREGKL